jgi:hypothetical protein
LLNIFVELFDRSPTATSNKNRTWYYLLLGSIDRIQDRCRVKKHWTLQKMDFVNQCQLLAVLNPHAAGAIAHRVFLKAVLYRQSTGLETERYHLIFQEGLLHQ